MENYQCRIKALHYQLGIEHSYADEYPLTLQPEAKALTDIGTDVYGRPQQLLPGAAAQWQAMQSAAAADGIALYVVSAFRSVDKQAAIIRAKQARGSTLDEILNVCAAPGYSEHHSGRALDLATDNSEPLSEAFELTPAFRWLTHNGARFRFSLSYPKESTAIVYEPWHWMMKDS